MFLRGGGTVSRRILITGGARSGKSRFALSFGGKAPYSKRLYVATAIACDPEMARRIARHQKERDGQWQTLEEPLRLPERLPKRWSPEGNLVVVDCLPTFLTNLLLEGFSHRQIQTRVGGLLSALKRQGLMAVFVTNEVGLGVVPDHPLGREFRDLLGQVNQRAACACDEVYLLVAGLTTRLK